MSGRMMAAALFLGAWNCCMIGAAGKEAGSRVDQVLRAYEVKAGDGVYVTDTRGRRVKGRISDVSARTLTVSNSSTRTRTWAHGEISRIERQDSPANGILWGTGLATAAFMMSCRDLRAKTGFCNVTGAVVEGVPYLAVGAVAGWILDVITTDTIYERKKSLESVGSSISVEAEDIGLRVSLVW